MSDLVKQIRAALACGTPLIGVATPDQRATVRQIVDGINGRESPRVQWDFVNGFTAAVANTASAEAVSQLPDPCQSNAFGAIVTALKLPAKTVVFIHLANRWIADPGVIQAIANLRDEYKATHRAMIFLGPSLDLVTELQSDVVVFDEPLPDRAQLASIVESIHVAAAMEIVQLLQSYADGNVCDFCTALAEVNRGFVIRATAKVRNEYRAKFAGNSPEKTD